MQKTLILSITLKNEFDNNMSNSFFNLTNDVIYLTFCSKSALIQSNTDFNNVFNIHHGEGPVILVTICKKRHSTN